MNLPAPTIENICPRCEIAAYIDGEMSPNEEIALEIHLAKCASCAAELNEQKKMLRVLDFALDEAEVELPANFTKVVVTNAESAVSGLRQPEERFNALFVCAGLFLLALLGLGSETGAVFETFVKFGEQGFAVAGFIARLVYDIGIGTAVILRSLSSQFVFNSATSIVLLFVVFFVSLASLSRLIVRFNRA